MFPVSDVIPSRTTPLVTIALIAGNVLVFFYQLILTPVGLEQFVASYAVIPAWLWWPSIVTSQFLHGGWLHIVWNMIYLWIFGDNVEDRLGHLGFLVFYLGAGGAAAVLQILFNPFSGVPMVGASGAIAGVMGAYFVLYPQSRVLTAIFLDLHLRPGRDSRDLLPRHLVPDAARHRPGIARRGERRRRRHGVLGAHRRLCRGGRSGRS